VYRTYEPTRDRLVAVKVFRLDITPEQAQSLADELAKAADAGLFHPSIVEPIAAGIEGTVAYRAEEYVAAESLDVALRHYAPAALDKVLPFITQLAGAIDFARASGVGHGALHPRDIFVTPEEARATGFGVVEALERVGQRAPVRRPYSAPERVEGGAWSTAADVFSLGVIAFELLTGRRPAGTGVEIGPLTGAAADSGSDAVHAVLVRAMHQEPERRYQSALAFASALESAGRGEAPQSGVTEAIAVVPVVATADEIEDGVAEMPPPAGIDEREEPAEADLEEDLFRSEEEDPVEQEAVEEAGSAVQPEADSEDDDLLDEDEDEDDDFALAETLEEDEPAANAVTGTLAFSDDLEKLHDTPEPSLTALGDEEDAEDDIEELAEVEEEQDEAAEPLIVADPGPRRYVSLNEPEPAEDHDAIRAPEFATVAAERPGPAFLPVAVGVILGLLIGFGAGRYTAPGGSDAPPSTQTAVAPAPAAGDTSGKAYSEQAVTPAQPQQPSAQAQQPPTEPPAIPSEVPAPAGATPAPARAAATSGTITINSQPSRAGVTINGVWRGRTPLKLDKLAFGSYVIRVVQPGYAVAVERMTLAPDDAAKTFSAVLQRSARTTRAATPPAATRPQRSGTGELYVDSRPRGATVIVDGKSVGVTPVRLRNIAAGAHAVRLELVNHSTWRTSATVPAGREARVTASLERIR
jgi:hypothetical protein